MHFERLAPLGRGGMGVVDLARQPGGGLVALKRLTLQGSAREMARARQRLVREAEALTRLRHPNVVELLEVVDDGGEITLVMPYLTGGTLADRVAHHGPAPAAEVERLATQLAGARAAAHRAGIVHRDITPANVLFAAEGVPHLADFGVATLRDATGGLTATGTVVGTPGYLAPEQARGDEVDRPADVFALGATLRFAATGEGPYGRGAPELLMVRAAKGRVDPLPRSVPKDLRRRIEAMLDPRPERRPTAAAVVAGPQGTRVLAPLGRQRRRSLVIATATAAAVVAVAGLVAVASRDTRASPPAERGEGATDTSASSTTTECQPLPYQPCGQAEPAAGTDGRRCVDDRADYDGLAVNGCEAVPDGIADGTDLGQRVEATIVPATDVDRFTLQVPDRRQLLCDGRLVVTLTAPRGMALRLRLLDGDEVRGEAVSADGTPAEVALNEPSCLFDDAATLVAEVGPVGSDRTAEPYVVQRRGSF